MGKLTVFTTITPLPSNVPRQLALDMLHAHTEVIELNPLVTGVKSIEAPRDASSDEYFSQWYEITEIITWGLGLKKKLSFKGVFHDQPWGLQTHVYLPLGVDLRNKYRIGGNQPGEPREARELGIDTPLDGLYLRNDVEIICNITMASFIKKETKAAIGVMIERMTRKAELLDEGKLHAMFENGRLKTTKPTIGLEDNPATVVASPPTSPAPFRTSPALHSAAAVSPALDQRGFGNYHEVARNSVQYQAGPGSSGYSPHQNRQYPAYTNETSVAPVVNELPGSYSYQPAPQQAFTAELPGDITYNPVPSQPPQQSLDVKPPIQYQAYAPPAPQQQVHPAARHSIANPPPAPPAYHETRNTASGLQQQEQVPPAHRGSQTGISGAHPQAPTYRENQPVVANHQSQAPAQRANRTSVASPQQVSPPDPGNRESQTSISSFAHAARKHSAASSVYSNPTPTTATSVSSIGGGSVRPSSNTPEPDHSRFASLSIGNGNGSNIAPAPPNSTGTSSSSPPPQSLHSRSPPPPSLARQNKSPKCPVCGLFEGDEAAISHHVGQAHFS